MSDISVQNPAINREILVGKGSGTYMWSIAIRHSTLWFNRMRVFYWLMY